MKKKMLKKSEVLREGYIKGLKKAQSIINEMARGRVFDDDTTEFINGHDERDQKYYRNSTYATIPFREGDKTYWYRVERPQSLNTSFCYGYGYNGVSDDEDERDAHSQVGNESFQQFLDSNIEQHKWMLNMLKTGKDPERDYYGTRQPVACLAKRYDAQRTGEAWFIWIPASIETEEDAYRYVESNWELKNRIYNCDAIHLLTPEEKERVIKAYEGAVADITKRCETYWKRYGNTKFRSWSYLRD